MHDTQQIGHVQNQSIVFSQQYQDETSYSFLFKLSFCLVCCNKTTFFVKHLFIHALPQVQSSTTNTVLSGTFATALMVPGGGGWVWQPWWCWYVRCFCWVQSPLLFWDGSDGIHFFAWCWPLCCTYVICWKSGNKDWKAKQSQPNHSNEMSTFGFVNLRQFVGCY